jgi:malonyl-CoA O-methyltransferase
VTAVDFSDRMLAKARAKAGADRVRFENHDVTRRLPYADASFDRVLSALVLEHVADVAAFFRELGRVTRADGRIVVTAMHPAMFLRGVSARFRDDGTGEFLRPRSYVMQLSDYVMGALDANLRIVSLVERSPDEALAVRVPRAAKYVGWPMLFVMTLKRA